MFRILFLVILFLTIQACYLAPRDGYNVKGPGIYSRSNQICEGCLINYPPTKETMLMKLRHNVSISNRIFSWDNRIDLHLHFQVPENVTFQFQQPYFILSNVSNGDKIRIKLRGFGNTHENPLELLTDENSTIAVYIGLSDLEGDKTIYKYYPLIFREREKGLNSPENLNKVSHFKLKWPNMFINGEHQEGPEFEFIYTKNVHEE